jgi:hypothetical protein
MPLSVHVVQGQASFVTLVQPPLDRGKGPNPRTGTARSTGFPRGLVVSGRTAWVGSTCVVSAAEGGELDDRLCMRLCMGAKLVRWMGHVLQGCSMAREKRRRTLCGDQ